MNASFIARVVFIRGTHLNPKSPLMSRLLLNNAVSQTKHIMCLLIIKGDVNMMSAVKEHIDTAIYRSAPLLYLNNTNWASS